MSLRLCLKLVIVGMLISIVSCGGKSEKPPKPVHYDQKANKILATKPDQEFLEENPEATDIGCCSLRVDEYHWQCSIRSYQQCRARRNSGCVEPECADGRWGYLPRVTGNECFRRCSYMDKVVLRQHHIDSMELDIPQGSWAQFRYMQDLAAEARCEDAQKVSSIIDLEFMQMNESSILLTHAQCIMAGRGELENAEELATEVYERPETGNDMTATGVVSDSYKYRCQFDKAIEWAYKGEESRPDYLAPEVMVSAAQLYDLQGRPELATRIARNFVDSYAFGYYEQEGNQPPDDVTFNRRSARHLHKENRAIAWRILAANHSDITIPKEDREYLKKGATPVDAVPPQFGEFFFESEASVAYSLIEAHDAILRMQSKEVLGLSEEKLADLYQFAEKRLHAIPEGEGKCELLADRLRERLRRVDDKDGDGIPDEKDKCPDEPETFNGYKDKDGCPDEEARTVKLVERQIVIDERVRFHTDKATLRKESKPILDGVVELLKKYPQIQRIRIEGHTDERAPDDYNMELSRRRAQSVQSYMLEHGISPQRMESRGYGETHPLAIVGDDASEEEKQDAWQQNRRVEFFIVESDPIYVEVEPSESQTNGE